MADVTLELPASEMMQTEDNLVLVRCPQDHTWVPFLNVHEEVDGQPFPLIGDVDYHAAAESWVNLNEGKFQPDTRELDEAGNPIGDLEPLDPAMVKQGVDNPVVWVETIRILLPNMNAPEGGSLEFNTTDSVSAQSVGPGQA